LAVLPLRLPPLRERGRDEIADLAVRLLVELRRNLRCGPDRISPEAIAHLQRYTWPGNVRELRNVLERVLLVAADAEEVGPAHLPPELVVRRAAGRSEDPSLSLEDVERRHIAHVLAHHAGNRSRTARTLGISRATLYEKLSRYGLDEVGRTRRRPESGGTEGEAGKRG
jgi:DNA-binding NtrC family response regulator